MSKPSRSIPIFPLDSGSTWEDLLNAMDASVQYQTRHGGQFGPIFAFAPMAEPEDLDEWEPFDGTPGNLLIVSIARTADARLLKAFAGIEPTIGRLEFDSSAPCSQQEGQLLLADTYAEMEEAGTTASWCRSGVGEDDTSFFCLRGASAILAFNKMLAQL